MLSNHVRSLDLLRLIDHRSMPIPRRWALRLWVQLIKVVFFLLALLLLALLLFMLRAKQSASPILSSKRDQLHRSRTLHLQS